MEIPLGLVIFIVLLLIFVIFRPNQELRIDTINLHTGQPGVDKQDFFNVDLKKICRDACKTDRGVAPGKPVEKPIISPDLMFSDQRHNKNALDSIRALSNTRDDLCGDDKFTSGAIHRNLQAKQSMINRALLNKNTFLPYFERELNDHENSVWWEDSSLENAL